MLRADIGVYLTKFRTYKIALPPQTKPRREGGLSHLPPSPFTGQLFKKSRHLGFGVFIDIWSMVPIQDPAGVVHRPLLKYSNFVVAVKLGKSRSRSRLIHAKKPPVNLHSKRKGQKRPV